MLTVLLFLNIAFLGYILNRLANIEPPDLFMMKDMFRDKSEATGQGDK